MCWRLRSPGSLYMNIGCRHCWHGTGTIVVVTVQTPIVRKPAEDELSARQKRTFWPRLQCRYTCKLSFTCHLPWCSIQQAPGVRRVPLLFCKDYYTHPLPPGEIRTFNLTTSLSADLPTSFLSSLFYHVIWETPCPSCSGRGKYFLWKVSLFYFVILFSRSLFIAHTESILLLFCHLYLSHWCFTKYFDIQLSHLLYLWCLTKSMDVRVFIQKISIHELALSRFKWSALF